MDAHKFCIGDLKKFKNTIDTIEYNMLSSEGSLLNIFSIYLLGKKKKGYEMLWFSINGIVFVWEEINEKFSRGICVINHKGRSVDEVYDALLLLNSKSSYEKRMTFDNVNNAYCNSSVTAVDYIFSVDEQINLVGKKFQNRRTTINKFLKTYENVEFREATLDDFDEVLNVYKVWQKQKIEIGAKEYSKNSDFWDNGLIEMLYPYLFNELSSHSKTYVVLVDGKIEGYTIVEDFLIDGCHVVIRLANKDLYGINDYMWRESLIAFTKDKKVTYENDGMITFSGFDSLSDYKNSHRPIEKVKLCKLS